MSIESPQAEHHEHHEHAITIIVNAQRKTVHDRAISFEQVVSLAYDGHPPTGDNWEFTVTYRHGPAENRQGSLVAGGTVEIKDEMIFNVTATDKS